MTLATAWIRNSGGIEELLVASDSRLRFGCAWDCCPKILVLPRSDSVICFAGDTMYAYPMMIQLQHAITMHHGLMSRAIDLTDLRGHVLRIFNGMQNWIHDLPANQSVPEEPAVLFILAGYSWKVRQFRIWTLHFDRISKKFQFKSATWHKGRTKGTKYFMFEGDHVVEARARLYKLLRERKKLTTGGLDMEPFEILRDMIRHGNFQTIGGPPQIVKVYQHMNNRPYSVYWPDRAAGTLTCMGRPLLNYEKAQFMCLDPDTLTVEQP